MGDRETIQKLIADAVYKAFGGYHTTKVGIMMISGVIDAILLIIYVALLLYGKRLEVDLGPIRAAIVSLTCSVVIMSSFIYVWVNSKWYSLGHPSETVGQLQKSESWSHYYFVRVDGWKDVTENNKTTNIRLSTLLNWHILFQSASVVAAALFMFQL